MYASQLFDIATVTAEPALSTIKIIDHSTDVFPSFTPTTSITGADIAIIVCCVTICVLAGTVLWWWRWRKRELTVVNGLAVPSLRSEIMDMLRNNNTWRIKSIWPRWRGKKMALEESLTTLRELNASPPNLNTVKITHPEMDLEKAIMLRESCDGRADMPCFDVHSAMGFEYGCRGNYGYGIETLENDDDDTDSNWTLGQEWRHINVHPGKRIRY